MSGIRHQPAARGRTLSEPRQAEAQLSTAPPEMDVPWMDVPPPPPKKKKKKNSRNPEPPEFVSTQFREAVTQFREAVAEIKIFDFRFFFY